MMVKDYLRRFPLALRLRGHARGVAARLDGTLPRVKRWLLTTGLVAAYFLVVTPIAFVRRLLVGRSLAHPAADAKRGWQLIRQSSADKQIYLSDY
ncbi:MAG: hypothetical protein IT515_16815 [Burkholderiales bacterium]|nr:hypothetical protein [Burkholderiales bacterium]